jgi:hypothetical protein
MSPASARRRPRWPLAAPLPVPGSCPGGAARHGGWAETALAGAGARLALTRLAGRLADYGEPEPEPRPGSQRRALPEIEWMPRRADRCLAAKSGMSSRLAVDEEMPSAGRAIPGSAPRRGGMTPAGQLACRPRVLPRICGRGLAAAGTGKAVSGTARRHLAAGQVRASPQEKDSR